MSAVLHEVEGAVPGPTGGALISCVCGFMAKGDTWEEAGAEMDAHLDPEEDGS